MRRMLASLWILTLVVASSAPWAEGATGTLTYPTEDNIRMAEGSVEFWMKTPLNVAERLSDGAYEGLLSVFQLAGESGALNVSLYTGASYKGTAGLWCSIGSQKVDLHPFGLGRFIPEPGAWYHMALTWKGSVLRFYLDGEQRAEKTCMEPLTFAFGPMGTRPLRFGDEWGRRGEMVLDEVRVSSVARTPEELGFHGTLKPDPFTMILDDFEKPFNPDGQTRTQPAIVFAGEGGLPSKACSFVEGKFGTGLALYAAE